MITKTGVMMRLSFNPLSRLCVRFVMLAALIIAQATIAFSADELRTWTDTKTKKTVKAKFIKLEDGKVTLELESAKQVTVPLDRLIPADSIYIANQLAKGKADDKGAKDNAPKAPIGPQTRADKFHADAKARSEKFFADVEKKREQKAAAEAAARAAAGMTILRPDWSKVRKIDLKEVGGGGFGIAEVLDPEKKLDAPEMKPGDVAQQEPAPAPKAIAIPHKKSSNEKNYRLHLSRESSRILLSFASGSTSDVFTHIALVDIDKGQGKSIGAASTKGEYDVLAINSKGDQLLVNASDFFGHHYAAEVWKLTNKGIERVVCWDAGEPKEVPENGKPPNAATVTLGKFVDDDTVFTKNDEGDLVLWNFEKGKIEPVAAIKVAYADKVTVNDKKKTLTVNLFHGGSSTFSFDSFQKSVDIDQSDSRIMSPSGKYAVVLGSNSSKIIDVATKAEVYKGDYKSPVRGKIFWTSDSGFLIDMKKYFDIESNAVIWNYEGVSEIYRHQGINWCWIYDSEKGADVITPVKFPHDGAVEAFKSFVPPAAEYYLQPPTNVALDLTGITDGQQRELAEKALTAELERLGYKIDPNAACKVIGKNGTRDPQEREYAPFGSRTGTKITVSPAYTSLEYMLNGRSIWSTSSGGHIPYSLYLKQNETIADALRPYEQPDFKLFTQPRLPEKIQKGTTEYQPGTSTLTSEGFVKSDGKNERNRPRIPIPRGR